MPIPTRLIVWLTLAIGLVLTTVASGATSDRAPGAVDLSFKLDADQTHRFEYAVTSTQAMSAFGQNQTSKTTMGAVIELVRLPSEQSADQVVVGLTYRQLSISFDGGQVPGSFDSKNPAPADQGNVYAEVCRPLLNEQIRLVVDARGSIKQVEGLDALAPDGLAGVLFGQLFGPEASKAMFQPLLSILDEGSPNRSVSDTWQVERPAVSSLGVPASPVELRVLEIQPRTSIAVLSVSGEPKAEMPADASVLPNVETREASLTGRLHWNAQLGILESLETESITEMVSDAQGISITVKSASTTRVKRLSQ